MTGIQVVVSYTGMSYPNDEATSLIETRQTKGITRRKPAFGRLASCDWLV